MSGEGALPYRHAIPTIDGVAVPDSRTLPIVAARRDGNEWRVWISCQGHATELTAERARQMAQDVLHVCSVIEGQHPALRQAEGARGEGAGAEEEAKPRVEHGATVESEGPVARQFREMREGLAP